jgi:hypothetical protein
VRGNVTHQAVAGRALCNQRFPKPALIKAGANCCACANAAKVAIRKSAWWKSGHLDVVLSRSNALDIWHRAIKEPA